MTKKLPTIGKNEILTVLVVFAAVFAKTLYEMSILGPILPETLIRVSVASVAFSVFLLVSFSKSIGRSFTGQDFVGVFALIYTLGVTIEMRVIRFDILTFMVCLSVILLLAKNVYALIAAAVLSVFMSVFINYAAVVCIPAAIGVSMVIMAPKFVKAKPASKKKSKKAEAKPKNDNIKEEIIFGVCQAIMFVAAIYAHYVRRFSMAAISFKYNIKLIIPILILDAVLIALTVIAIKKKRPVFEIVGYIIPALFSVMSMFMEYSLVATEASAVFFALFIMCGKGSLAGETVENIKEKLSEKISGVNKKAETEA